MFQQSETTNQHLANSSPLYGMDEMILTLPLVRNPEDVPTVCCRLGEYELAERIALQE